MKIKGKTPSWLIPAPATRFGSPGVGAKMAAECLEIPSAQAGTRRASSLQLFPLPLPSHCSGPFLPSLPHPPLFHTSFCSCVCAQVREQAREKDLRGGGVCWGLVSTCIFFSCSSSQLAREVECWEEGDGRIESSQSTESVGEGSGIGENVASVYGFTKSRCTWDPYHKRGPDSPALLRQSQT